MTVIIDGTNRNDVIYQDGDIEVEIYGYGGNDKIYLDLVGPDGGFNYVDAGTGNDRVENDFEGGNKIYLGAGNDTYILNAFDGLDGDFDIVKGGAGDDYFEILGVESDYYGESGNDTFLSVGFNNYFNGGTGIDTISYELQDEDDVEAGRGVTIDLGGKFASTGAGRRETLISIENAVGTDSDDDITGSSAKNVLSGLDGDDFLFGLAGNDTLLGGTGDDTLEGGTGNDTLTGGLGYDFLKGGAGADVFKFASIDDSAVGRYRDVILDFSRAQRDKIDLRDIDANEFRAGDQKFTFIGKLGFSGTAGELNFRGGVVSGDVDGDGVADFQIKVSGVSTLTLGDFYV
ncbi:calcium-binding protein [Ensifer soli]|uniref:calcium-binding protein n=1 Tax=Ciceribacter sp. sgz301302 TaxID=3342379 RepID=UPI0035B9C029